jgi:YVTN family beta-propeller protein
MPHRFSVYIATFLFGAVACSSNSDGVSAPSTKNPTNTNRKAYVGLFGDQAIAVLDTVTGQVLTKIPVTAPDGLIITPDGKKVYVSSMDSGSVKVITTANDTIATSIDVGAKPAGLAITPDGTRVVVSAGGSNEAVIVDATTDTIVKHVAVAAAHAACISADGRYAYVGSQATDAPAVVEVDITGDSSARSMPVDKSPRMLSCSSGKVYFTAVGLDAVEVLDVATGKLATPITSGGSPHDVRSSADGKFELVVSQTAGDLEFIDVSSAAVVDKVATGKLAHWITPFADGTGAYVTNEGDNNVVAVDFASKRVTNTIAIGSGPRKMALQP